MPLRSRAVMAAALLLSVFAAIPARAADFTDPAGRRVVLPPKIGRIMAANPAAEALVFVLAPDKLVGLSGAAQPGAGAVHRVPVLGGSPGPNPAGMAETARRLRPDLIIDAGPVTPERATFAEEIQQQTATPYILVDDSFAQMPAMLRSVGTVLGVAARGEDLAFYAEHAIAAMRGHLLIRSPDTRPRIYYGRRADGLETALPGSSSAAAIDEAGAINVAAPLGRGQRAVVTREQILAWDPEMIIAEQRSFYSALQRSPAWGRLAAVRHKRVYLAPSDPYGWIDDPPGVNRLIGLHWLLALFYPDNIQEDFRATLCDFYAKFYRIKLTNAQLEALVEPAGTSPADGQAAGEVDAASRLRRLELLLPGTSSLPVTKSSPDELCAVNWGTAPPGTAPYTSAPDIAPQPKAPAIAIAPAVPPPGRRSRGVTSP
jgi:iron complex transport system substrate-binding protein